MTSGRAGGARRRGVAWAKEEPSGGAEYVEAEMGATRLHATGVAIHQDPKPYRLDYALDTSDGFVTARLQVQARGEGWQRRLELTRDPDGGWSADVRSTGDGDLPPAGADVATLAGALDCDLGLSPFTNSMPVLRHGLLHGGAPVTFLMAWVSVPDLRVTPAAQRYTCIRPYDGAAAIVRFDSLDGSGFTADLTFDQDGLVIAYPHIARRLP